MDKSMHVGLKVLMTFDGEMPESVLEDIQEDMVDRKNLGLPVPIRQGRIVGDCRKDDNERALYTIVECLLAVETEADVELVRQLFIEHTKGYTMRSIYVNVASTKIADEVVRAQFVLNAFLAAKSQMPSLTMFTMMGDPITDPHTIIPRLAPGMTFRQN